ncbi:MAG: hypothetical protein Q7S19_03570 [bacterium]|nr:hypothetical protein [bacterium]
MSGSKMTRDELIGLIKNASASIQDKTIFCKVINSVLDSGLLMEQYFCGFGSPIAVNSSTLAEWRAGTLVPHSSFCKSIYTYLLNTLEPLKVEDKT